MKAVRSLSLLGLKRLHGFLEVTTAQRLVISLFVKDYCFIDFTSRVLRFGINKWYQSFALRNFDLEDMELESINSGPTAKLPILKLENGDSWVSVPQTTQENGTSVTKMSIPVTAEEKTNKKNDVKARGLLLMALPNEHQLTFSQYPDAKSMFAAIETRFGGNAATKKTQKTLLKQQYENFSASSAESLDSIFNRLQKIVSRLAILGVIIAQEDLNLKFLSSLPPEWNTHVVVWMNKPEVETMSIDDLYNNFKIVEQKVKKIVGTSSGGQNLAFMTAPSTSSTNDANTASPQVSAASPSVNADCPQVYTASVSDNTVYAFMVENPNGSNVLRQDLEQIHEDDLEAMDLKWQLSLLSVRAKKYFQRTGRKIFINANDTAGYDKSKVECYNCHKLGHFSRECRAPRSKEYQFRNQDNTRKQGNNEDTSSMKEQDESKTKPEKKTVIPTAAKIEKPVKKSVSLVEVMFSLEECNMVVNISGTSEENSQECIVMPIWKDTSYFDSPTENVDNGEPKTADDAQKQDEDGLNNENAEQERFLDDSSSKDVNVVGQQVNTASPDVNTGSLELNDVGPSVSTASPNEEDSTEEEPEVDLGNITNSYIVPNTPNTRIHKDHPIDNVIGRTSQFKLQQKVWILVDLPKGKKGQWNKMGKDRLTLFDQEAKSSSFTLYMSVDDIIFGSTNKELCTGFEKLMKDKFQMSSMGELTFFLGLQVQQKEDGIFISQDKYVAEILKKFNYSDVKSASTPVDLEKPLVKDGDADDVDVHLYRSMIRSLMYLTASRPDIMFAVCACARFQVTPKTSHLLAVKRIFRYLKGKPTLGLWYSRDSPFELVAYTDSDYAGAILESEVLQTGGC
ncbi:putative ribonuclease H-like domain-containing protein [Tanacetum coccineum]|uniref:Ribonuclease H-like domain-containing protein n=1 Tax=Tanacetum coccineum TaxID=301880 RepID=A0ABQ5J9V6_9ASTR